MFSKFWWFVTKCLTDCLTVFLFQVLAQHVQHDAWRSGYAGVTLPAKEAHDHLLCDVFEVNRSILDKTYGDPGVF